MSTEANQNQEPVYDQLPADITPIDQGVRVVVRGRSKKIGGMSGDEITPKVRIVNAPEGELIAVSGDIGDSVTIYEAGKVTTEPVSRDIQNTLNRKRQEIKRRKERAKKANRGGTTG